MWARHNVVIALVMIATVGGWRVVGFEDAAGLVPGSRGLVGLKNVLLRGALVTSVASAALGVPDRQPVRARRCTGRVGSEAAPETLRRRPGHGT